MHNLIATRNCIDKSININNKINSYVLFDFVFESCFIVNFKIILSKNRTNRRFNIKYFLYRTQFDNTNICRNEVDKIINYILSIIYNNQNIFKLVFKYKKIILNIS